jgi:hypothetical protein
MNSSDDKVWFEFVESKIFHKQIRAKSIEVLGVIQSDLLKNPERGCRRKGNAWRAKG